jgi:hypothetical protein
MSEQEFAPCIGGCGKECPVPWGHPALMSFLCDACRARILAGYADADTP